MIWVSIVRSYIKLYGPPILKAIGALDKIAVSMPGVCMMNTMIIRGIPASLAADLGGQAIILQRDAVRGYFEASGVSIPVERCENIISKSGEMLGEYDFFFEWFKEASQAQLNELIEKIDDSLISLGCYYTITTRR